jgi:hypothetical protein
VHYLNQLNDTSRMSREVHVRICGGRRVQLPPATRHASVKGGRALNHAQLLAKALEQCNKVKLKSKRAKCVAAAKKKYVPKKKTTKTKK